MAEYATLIRRAISKIVARIVVTWRTMRNGNLAWNSRRMVMMVVVVMLLNSRIRV